MGSLSISEAVPQVATAKRVRIESVDILRGVIMTLMALDHVRATFGVSLV